MKKAIFRTALTAAMALFCIGLASAQENDLVKWTTKVKHIENDLYEIVYSATIAPKYHMYDLGPYEGEYGPNITIFNYEDLKNVTLEGQPYEITKPKKVMEEMFGYEVGHYYNKAEFGQKVRLKGASGTVLCYVEWSVCDDVSCMPPAETEIQVTVKK